MSYIFYFILKQYCRIALWFYFKKWQVHFNSPLPNGPVIFVVNHQNAFLDAVLVSCSASRNPWFLARASVFNKGWVATILNRLKMLPVYRFRDGFKTLRKNDEMIMQYANLLTKGGSILIFAEGNHNERWNLRPLQKGFARIALAAFDLHDVKIIPVGLQFDSHSQIGTRVLVNFGNPISVKESIQSEMDTRQKIEALLEKTKEGLEPLMLNIDSIEYKKRVSHFLSTRIIYSDLVQQLKSDQQLLHNYRPEDLYEAKEQNKKRLDLISLYGLLTIYLAKTITASILKKKMKDPQFAGSLKFALGIVLVPLFFIIQSSAFYFITKSILITGIHFLSQPLAFLYYRNTKD